MTYRWYTKARKFPQMIGRSPDGTQLWGGPYTFTQIGVGVATAVTLHSTTWLWAQGGALFNILLALLLIGLAVYFAGYLPPGMRNPLVLAPGIGRTFNRGWRLNGSPLPTVKPQQVAGVSFVIENIDPAPEEELPEPEQQTAPPLTIAAPPAAAPTPALSSVQRLLLEGTLR